MKLAVSTIKALGKVITGDGNISPYRSGPQLVTFFNEYGGDTIYGGGFPSRWKFVEDELIRLNSSEPIRKIIEEIVNPAHYIDTEYDVRAVVEYLNKYLVYDKLRLIEDGMAYKIVDVSYNSNTQQQLINPDFLPTLNRTKLSHMFILEQVDKCREKIAKQDYDGAITNARSMMEAVCQELIIKSGEEVINYDGNLVKLYAQVKKCLNLDPSQKDLSDSLKQILTGLTSIVTGIAGISNIMGDRHARKYKPYEHHALFIINSANTLCGFLVSSFEYQKELSSSPESVE